METKEYWQTNNILVNVGSNGRVGVTLYYGSSRQYAIKDSSDIVKDVETTIKKLVKNCKEGKKYVTPLHGCTYYI